MLSRAAIKNVRIGSKADMCSAQADVRFAPNSDNGGDHSADVPAVAVLPNKPLRFQSGADVVKVGLPFSANIDFAALLIPLLGCEPGLSSAMQAAKTLSADFWSAWDRPLSR